MKHSRRLPALGLTILLGLIGSPALGEGQTATDWALLGGFQLGFRAVDVDGRDEKYREDVNLEEGPRLFNLRLDLTPPQELRRYFDRLEMNVENAGGDPLESLRFAVERYGRYALELQQGKSAYFYEDLLLPPEVTSSGSVTAADLHTFDFDRVRDRASLSLWLGEAAQLDFGFDRFTKKGRSTTTYDIQRDVFQVERPIDESLTEYHASLAYDWRRVTLLVSENVRKYVNSVEAFVPGASDGLSEDDPTVLDFFFLRQPYNLSSYGHRAAIVARPNDRLLVQIEVSREDLDLDVEVSEKSRGVDFSSEPFATNLAGAVELDRELSLLDLSVSYRLSDRITVILDGKRNALEQDGSLGLDGSLTEGVFELDTSGAELALQVDASSEITLSAGVRSESRESADADDPTTKRKTDHTGYFALLGWHPDRHLSVTARFDLSSFDNPLAAASPSERESVRLRARYGRPQGLSLSGHYRLDSLDNAASGWRAESEQLGVRAGYRFPPVSLSLGYARFETDRDIDQRVTTLPGFLGRLEFAVPIAYRADAEIVDGRFSWAVNPRLKLGGDVRLYDNDGSFALQRWQSRLFAEVGFGRSYIAHLGLRRVDYDEGANDFDDYRADIVELSFGYRWR